MQTAATSIKMPAELKAAISEYAAAEQLTPHAYMLRAIEDRLEADKQRATFYADGLKALDRMDDTGLAYDFEEVAAYFEARARGETPRKPRMRQSPGFAHVKPRVKARGNSTLAAA